MNPINPFNELANELDLVTAQRDKYKAIIERFGSWLDHWSIKTTQLPSDVYAAWDNCREPK